MIILFRLRENASLSIQFYSVDLFFLSIYILIYRNPVHNFRAIIISFLLLMSANLTKVLCDNLFYWIQFKKKIKCFRLTIIQLVSSVRTYDVR